jgi:hypothetical protein
MSLSSHHPLGINNLAVDLLKEIFMWGVFGSERYQSAPQYRVFRYGAVCAPGGGLGRLNPILIGHVCAYWRQLSLSTPLLWSSISVMAFRLKDFEVFTLWLERSGNASLSLILGPSPSSSKELGDFPQFLRLAFQHSRRWKKFILRAPELDADTINKLALAWQDMSFDRLEQFSMTQVRPSAPSTTDFEEWNPFPELYLTSLVLKELDLTWSNPMHWLQGAALHRLTSLSVRYTLTPSQILKLLLQCQSLEELSIQVGAGAWDGDGDTFTPPIHSNLKSLTISHARHIPGFMKRVHIPRLERLHLKGNLYEKPKGASRRTALEMITDRIELVEWPLKYLSMQYIREPAQAALLRFLSLPSLSGLEELDLLESGIGDTIIEALIITPTTKLLPEMRSFSISQCFSSRDLTHRMIQSRSATLRRITGAGGWVGPVPGVIVG